MCKSHITNQFYKINLLFGTLLENNCK